MYNTGRDFISKIRNDTYGLIEPRKLDLSGKVVVITGASRGVGKAIAISYAKAGASGIVLGARSSLESVAEEVKIAAKESGRPAPKVVTIKIDTTDRENVEAAAKQVENVFGKVDVLLNNAGYLETFKQVAESDPDEWWKTFEVNVKGVYLMTRSFLPLVLKGELKTILQTSSVGAFVVLDGGSAYETTKQAVLRFNNFLMNEYGDKGLLAYGFHPGAVMTELARNMPEYTHGNFKDTPELCGDTVVWLTSEKRDWLADRYVSVTWDMQELLSRRDDIVSRDLLKVKLMV